MTNGATTETVQDGRSVVCSATHLTAFSVIAYSSCSLHKQTTPFTHITSLKEQLLLCIYTIYPTCVCILLITQPCSVMWHPRTEMNFNSGPYLKYIGLIDERTLNLSTAVPTVVVTNNVASGRDIPVETETILPTLQTLLPSNVSGYIIASHSIAS